MALIELLGWGRSNCTVPYLRFLIFSCSFVDSSLCFVWLALDGDQIDDIVRVVSMGKIELYSTLSPLPSALYLSFVNLWEWDWWRWKAHRHIVDGGDIQLYFRRWTDDDDDDDDGNSFITNTDNDRWSQQFLRRAGGDARPLSSYGTDHDRSYFSHWPWSTGWARNTYALLSSIVTIEDCFYLGTVLLVINHPWKIWLDQ